MSIVHSTMLTAHLSVSTTNSTMSTVHSAMSNVHSTMLTVHNSVNCTLDNVSCTFDNVNYTFDNVTCSQQCHLYTRQSQPLYLSKKSVFTQGVVSLHSDAGEKLFIIYISLLTHVLHSSCYNLPKIKINRVSCLLSMELATSQAFGQGPTLIYSTDIYFSPITLENISILETFVLQEV